MIPPRLRGFLALTVLLAAGCATSNPHLPGHGPDRGKTVVYRDTWGVPHIYAPSIEAAMYAIGWAQAEDRPEELLKNFLRGIGESAAVDGPGAFQSDLRARLFDHYGAARRNADRIDPELRRYIGSFVRGVNDYYAAHPADRPDWWGRRQVDEAMVHAFGRLFLHNWSIDDGYDDLRRAGINPNLPRVERGSNQWAVSPSRSAEGVPILLIDPHLSWWGPSRFWEFRVHAGPLRGSGFTLPAFPTIGLGHNERVAWAMTTGGPDTADVYELTLHPDDPTQYRYEGQWRRMTSREVVIEVKEEPPRRATLWASHHGPVIAQQNGKAYALRTSYAEEVNSVAAWFKFNMARDYRGAIAATETLQIFPQNVMVADTSGNIYYQRTGRVPIRPEGYDWSRPVDGSTSATEWKGIHPVSDLVQALNPPQGYMQNCNIPPDAMMVDCPLTPDRYLPEIFSDLSHGPRGGWTNPRGARAVELLAADASVTIEEALAYAVDIRPYGTDRWLEVLRRADEAAPALRSLHEHAVGMDEVLAWDGALRRDSIAALKYFYWREQLARDLGDAATALARRVDFHLSAIGRPAPPIELEQDQLEAIAGAFAAAMARLKAELGRLDATYGDVFRVGREDRSWPLEGGGQHGTSSLRNIGYAGPREDGTRWGRSGQTSTQIVVLSRPIRSWTAVPIGQSDRPDSPHFRDQAERLFSERKLKPTWWRPEELRHNVESRTVLEGAP